jgi:hypothetical protein
MPTSIGARADLCASHVRLFGREPRSADTVTDGGEGKGQAAKIILDMRHVARYSLR